MLLEDRVRIAVAEGDIDHGDDVEDVHDIVAGDIVIRVRAVRIRIDDRRSAAEGLIDACDDIEDIDDAFAIGRVTMAVARTRTGDRRPLADHANDELQIVRARLAGGLDAVPGLLIQQQSSRIREHAYAR